MTHTIGIVDPSSGGQYVAARAEALGFHVVRLASESHSLEAYRSLRAHGSKLAAVIPGAESGVIAAEQWASELALKGNDPRTSPIRRNKHAMAEALCRQNVPICRQAFHTSVEAAIEWADHVGYPVVVKPTESSGSDMVRVCRSSVELRDFSLAIMNGKNKYGLNSIGVLVQEFMEGEEYTLDGVVSGGVFIPFAVGRYQKELVDGNFVYDLIEFHAPDDGLVDPRIVPYGERVVRALEVVVGPVHIEIMLTPKGPLLVELAARPHGGIATGVIDETFEPSFTEAIIRSYTSVTSSSNFRVSQKKKSLIFFLKVRSSGIVRHLPGKGLLQSIPSFVSSKWFVEVGGMAAKTIDLATCPALVHLSYDDIDILEDDLATLVKADKSGELIEMMEKQS